MPGAKGIDIQTGIEVYEGTIACGTTAAQGRFGYLSAAQAGIASQTSGDNFPLMVSRICMDERGYCVRDRCSMA